MKDISRGKQILDGNKINLASVMRNNTLKDEKIDLKLFLKECKKQMTRKSDLPN